MVFLVFSVMYNIPIYESENVLEFPSGRSETIPNQTKSVREILARSARGQILSEVQANNLQYGEDEDPEGMDFIRPEDDKFDVRDKLSYYERRLQQAKDAQKAAKEAKKAPIKEESSTNVGDDADAAK